MANKVISEQSTTSVQTPGSLYLFYFNLIAKHYNFNLIHQQCPPSPSEATLSASLLLTDRVEIME